jgi:hypothetical protein
MSGLQNFLQEVWESKKMGPVVVSFGLTLLFVIAVFGFSTFSGGFMVTLTVIMVIALVVSLVFFFASLAALFDWAS